ncbi:unnamed protein product [Ambrosiozyma monospora]|uniref:Unnamed protein product n=1 Tax=Ambrosiozyma monospora TaxID=43982 RepID=A0ACB5TAC8_AMBMO|nr:unnamed protein product [Ambrosiozyma monospora]
MTDIHNQPHFQKIDNPKARSFKGNEFPIAYILERSQDTNSDSILELLKSKAKSGFFTDALRKNGAILLRNLGTTNPEVISKYIKAIGEYSNLKLFDQNGTLAQRHDITDVLTTANEGPPSNTLYQHNEFSRFTDYPTTLFFVCTKYEQGKTKGGNTPIVHGGELFEKLKAADLKKLDELARRGVYFKQVWNLNSDNNTSWRDKYTFGRNIVGYDEKGETFWKVEGLENQKLEAEKIVKDKVSPLFEWDSDDNLVVHQHTKAIKSYEGKYPVVFSSLPTFYASIARTSRLAGRTDLIRYGDSDTEYIPNDFLDLILDTSIEIHFG